MTRVLYAFVALTEDGRFHVEPGYSTERAAYMGALDFYGDDLDECQHLTDEDLMERLSEHETRQSVPFDIIEWELADELGVAQ